MKGKIWLTQKSLFKTLKSIDNILQLCPNIYANVPKNAIMPYILIKSIKIKDYIDVQCIRKNVEFEISIFDKSQSIKNISNVSDEIETNLTINNISTNQDSNINFLSLEHIETSISNDIQTSILNIVIKYHAICEFKM